MQSQIFLIFIAMHYFNPVQSYGCGCRACVPCQVCTPCMPCLPPPCPLPEIRVCPPLPPPCPPPRICPPAICPPPVICPPPPPPPPPRICPPVLPPAPCPYYFMQQNALIGFSSLINHIFSHFQMPFTPFQMPFIPFQMPLIPPPRPMPIVRALPVYMAVPLPQNDCCCFCASPCQFRARARAMHGARIFGAENSVADEDPSCNNHQLKDIMLKNIDTDPSTSKRAIQGAAEKELSGKFNVICANGDFSYVAYTESFCQTAKENITCYAFKSPGTDTSDDHNDDQK
ncbi:unnamed protein product [Anisakis simplex]|uniref:Ground-like domain-containing protein n=1 Tax=Anisakis simplex TaxID=6269 RepID=A0A0M3KC03_ANISI|nr:unnamed protein product [Anisakis simplex]